MELGRAEHRSGMDRRFAAPERIRQTSGHQYDAVRNALGRDTKPHGGKKKSDDNGGEGAPEGVKQFSPKAPTRKPPAPPPIWRRWKSRYAYTRTAYDDEKKPWASERGK
jgi:hypothetical protein